MIEVHPEHVAGPGEPRCEFALCRREAELSVTLADGLAPVEVCSIHLSPILAWGIPEPVEWPTIRYLWTRPETAA